MRADLILDLTGEPGRRYPVLDRDFQGREHRLTDLAYGETPMAGAAGRATPG